MDIIPGEKLAIKILETFENGFSGWLRPWQEKRVGKALNEIKADEIIKIAAAEKDAEDIQAGKKFIDPKGKLITIPQQPKALLEENATPTLENKPQGEEANPSTLEILRKAEIREQYIKIRREINLRKIAIHAFEEAQNQDDDEVADEPVDPGWFYQWQEKAQNIQDKDLQKLWAKTLAGEVKKPGSYSLFTIDFLHKLSKKDAELVSSIAKYKMKNPNREFIFLPSDKFFEENGIAFSQLLELESLGILSIGNNLLKIEWTSYSGKKIENFTVYGNKAIKFIKEGPDPKMTLKVYLFTNVGKEIVRLGNFGIDQNYLDLFIQELKDQGCKVYIGDLTKDRGEQLEVSNLKEV